MSQDAKPTTDIRYFSEMSFSGSPDEFFPACGGHEFLLDAISCHEQVRASMTGKASHGGDHPSELDDQNYRNAQNLVKEGSSLHMRVTKVTQIVEVLDGPVRVLGPEETKDAK